MDIAGALPWWGWCLTTSVCFACFLWVNAHFKLAAERLILMRSVVGCALILPALFFITFPSDLWFYGWVVAAALAGYAFDVVVYRVAAELGGAVVARLLPLRILMAFVVWATIQPDYVSGLFTENWRGLTVIFSLLGCTGALFFLSRCPVSWAALKQLIPAIFMLALTDIFAKLAVNHAPGNVGAASFLFPFIVCLTMIPFATVRCIRHHTLPREKSLWLGAGAIAGTLFFLQIMTKGLAMRVTPDPSYFTAINMLSAVWLYLYHKYARIPDHSNVYAGAAFIFFVGILVLTAPNVR